jgi:1-deoxy-D-xylulose-5-phosphate reductoisomerase
MRLTVLGATGSVGQSTLDLVAHTPAAFEVVALTAQTNAAELATLAIRHRARVAVIGDEAHYQTLKEHLAGTNIIAMSGRDSLVAAAQMPVDCVMAAIVGVAGLAPTLAATQQGCRIALANKECLVSAGPMFMRAVRDHGATLIPVDSEHSGILQGLSAHSPEMLAKITITASGGPFRTWEASRIANATPEDALKHPNWVMGRKITIDSATLMNKGLELIEAQHLFGVTPDQLDVLVHPQSVIHALVSYKDGSVLAQMASPDMRTPIALSLAWPKRMAAPTKPLDLAEIGSLTFERPDENKFPALRIAKSAMRMGQGATTALNAANEVAVDAFLAKRLKFPHIAQIVEQTIESLLRGGNLEEPHTLEATLALDQEARIFARHHLGAL